LGEAPAVREPGTPGAFAIAAATVAEWPAAPARTPAAVTYHGAVTGLRFWRARPAPPLAPSAGELAARAIAVATAGHLVLDAAGALLMSNRAAQDLGIVHAGIVDPLIVQRAMAAAGRDDPDENDVWEIVDAPGRPEVLRLSAQPLGDGLVLVTGTDETAARQTEAIRRDFVANVSHELKSPVTAIGLLAEAVIEAAESPETVRGFADRMRRESTRLGTLITELIALSALQGGSLEESDLVDIDDVIADALDRIAVPASAKDIEIRVDGPSGAVVLGDRSLLTTAVGNLVENAVHYSGAGSAVTISRVVRRGNVDIAVADQGIGIAPRDQRRIFERFFRADPARSRATGGTGLGLAIVKHTAANHGGSIRVASRLGVGSTFTLRLPVADESDVARSATRPGGAGPGIVGAGRTAVGGPAGEAREGQ
jgi:two-component system sensor histidine kinase SenX3